MKRGILLLLLAAGFTAQGQSLKDALYGGKLKNQAGTVIRKGDDLSTKIDTTAKTDTVQKIASVADSAKTKPAAPATAVKKAADAGVTEPVTVPNADTVAAISEPAPAVAEPPAA